MTSKDLKIEELVWVMYNEMQQMRQVLEQVVALQDNRVWLLYKEAREIYPVSQRTMDRMVEQGRLKVSQEAPGCLKLYNRWDLHKLAEG